MTCCPDDSKAVGKPVLDLKIRLDPEQGILSVVVNEAPVEIDNAVSSAHLRDNGKADAAAAQTDSTCCAPAEPAEEEESTGSCEARGQAFLRKLLQYSVITLCSAIALQLLVHRFVFAGDQAMLNRYGWWILYLDVSVVALVANLAFLRSYIYANASHMIGMVIGMTIGMQVGTMIGGVLGATNGFFIGAIVGMTLGSLYGVVTAWCCGPLAVMHGLMAGVMGGTMGSMVVVMMIPDHVLIFMPIFTTVNLLILGWFTYLFFKECVVGGRCQIKKTPGLPKMLGACLLTIGLLTALMVAGPKGPMVWKGPKRAPGGQPSAADPFSMKDGMKPGGVDGHGMEMVCGAMMFQPDEAPPRIND